MVMANIIDLIIFLKPGLESRLWAFSCCKPSLSPIQAHWWARLKWAGLGWALGLAQHITSSPSFKLYSAFLFFESYLLCYGAIHLGTATCVQCSSAGR